MAQWLLIGLPILLLWSLVDPLRAVRRGPGRVVITVIAGLFLVTIYHQLLRWDIYGLTFRTLLLPIYAVIVVLSVYLLRLRNGSWGRSRLLIAGAAVLVVGGWMFAVPRYPNTSEGRVAIDWPLETGRYAVIQGGTKAFNHHAPVDAQRYALDITKITGILNRRAKGILPRAFAAYQIYGADVIAPCDGMVLHVQDGRDETPIGQNPTGDVVGNMVALQCDTATVVLAHLQAGVPVTEGQVVTRGTILGHVGNSGNSTEPHLHIHAVPGFQEDIDCLLFTCKGVPIYFAGRTYARNDVVEVTDE